MKTNATRNDRPMSIVLDLNHINRKKNAHHRQRVARLMKWYGQKIRQAYRGRRVVGVTGWG